MLITRIADLARIGHFNREARDSAAALALVAISTQEYKCYSFDKQAALIDHVSHGRAISGLNRSSFGSEVHSAIQVGPG